MKVLSVESFIACGICDPKQIELVNGAWHCASAVKVSHFEWITMHISNSIKSHQKVVKTNQPTITQYNNKHLSHSVKLIHTELYILERER